MMKKLAHPVVLWGSRLFLGAIFLYAGFPKLLDLAAFAQSVDHYRIVPLEWVPAFATCLAGLEVSVGLALITGLWRRGSAFLVVSMLWMFVVAISYVYLDGRAISCGCGLDTKTISEIAELRSQMVERILQDLAMLLVAGHLLFQEWVVSLSDERRDSPNDANAQQED
jgi:hypothetical protein